MPGRAGMDMHSRSHRKTFCLYTTTSAVFRHDCATGDRELGDCLRDSATGPGLHFLLRAGDELLHTVPDRQRTRSLLGVLPTAFDRPAQLRLPVQLPGRRVDDSLQHQLQLQPQRRQRFLKCADFADGKQIFLPQA